MPQEVTITNFYCVSPVENGGQRRIFFLARELARAYNVRLITVSREMQFRSIRLAPSLTEIQVPADDEYRHAESLINRRVKMAGDLSYTHHWAKCITYQKVLHQALKTSAAAITAHPYSIYAIEAALGSRNTPIIYDSQNVELRQKKELLAPWPRDYQAIIDVERQCLHRCAKVVACAESDIEAFGEDYGIPAHRCALVPNGADVINAPRLTEEERVASRARLGLKDRFVCVFAGSYHFPNLRAVERIVEFARCASECLFVVFGGVSEYLTELGSLPPNVLGLGVINEAQKWQILGCCDLALNPMERGSGSNIKMFEFAAAKLPILSTPFGARGSRFRAGSDFVAAEIEEFADHIRRLRKSDAREWTCFGENAYQTAAEHYDWTVIGAKYADVVRKAIARQEDEPRCQADGPHDGQDAVLFMRLADGRRKPLLRAAAARATEPWKGPACDSDGLP
ncbi:MAG: glycosyltransferase family 4 protein [Planctomycetes bacterium]|nr:glycosyltransferase family 4 protein [Planctomycetota bacterium]